MDNFILATSSTYRQQQFAALGINAQIIPPDIDETPQVGEHALPLALRLSEAKARRVAKQGAKGLIIAADQTACLAQSPDEIFGKPHSVKNAVNQLMQCAGNVVCFHSALTIYDTDTAQCVTASEPTVVTFRQFSEKLAHQYVLCDNPLDCAGSFKAEKRGVLLFERIDSRDPNALIGLPVMLLRDMLASFSIDLLDLATR